MKKNYRWLIILLVILLVTGCQLKPYKKIIDSFFNHVEEKKFTSVDLPSNWRQVTFKKYKRQQEGTGLLRQVSDPNVNIVYVHGYGVEGEYYPVLKSASLSLYLKDVSYSANILSVQLSGWSADNKFDNLEDYAADILGGADYINEMAPQVPTVVVGHSLGGYSSLLAATYDQQDLIDGVISNSGFTNIKKLVNKTSYREEKSWPWYIRTGIRLIDEKLAGFFSNYDILNRVERIDVPVLLLSGKKDNASFNTMTWNVYRKLESTKQLYFIEDAGHVHKYYAQGQQLTRIYDNYFQKITQHKELKVREIDISYSTVKQKNSYQVTVRLAEKLSSKYLPVDICFKQGVVSFASRKYLYSLEDKQATFNLTFKPNDVYAFNPKEVKMIKQGWRYKEIKEETAYAQLPKQELVAFPGEQKVTNLTSYSQLTAQQKQAVTVLANSDILYYRSWLADWLREVPQDYQKSINLYQSLLKENISKSARVEYLYRLYRLYEEKLNNQQQAKIYYNRLLQYNHNRYYVAKAISLKSKP